MSLAGCFLVLLTVLAIVNAQGGSCVAKTSPEASGAIAAVTYCSDSYIPSQIFMPQGGFLNYSSYHRAIRYVATRLTVTRTCTDRAIRFFCSWAFQGCVQNGAVAVAIPPCKPVCTDYTSACAVTLGALKGYLNYSAAFYNAYYPGCNATANASTTFPAIRGGEPLFPDTGNSQIWDLSSNQTASQACAATPILNTENTFIPCYGNQSSKYYAFLPTTAGDQTQNYCRQECPPATYPWKVWQALATEMIVLSWIGIVGITLLAILRSLIPQYREYPANLTLFMLFGQWIVALSGIIPSFVGGFEKTLCHKGTSSRQDYGICTFQGICWFWGLTTFSLWWGAIAIHSLLSVIFRSEKIWNWKTQLATHCICWGYPTLTMIIGLAKEAFGARPAIPFCFIWKQAYQWGLFWDCNFFVILVGSICIIVLLIRMQIVAVKDTYHWSRNIRVLLFLITFDVMWFVNMSYRAYTSNRGDYWVDLVRKYVGCSIQSEGCIRGEVPSAPFAYVFILFVFGQSVIITLVFGSNKELFVNFWNVVRGKASVRHSKPSTIDMTVKNDSYMNEM